MPVATRGSLYSPQGSAFADIVLAVKRQLVSALELDPSLVPIVADRTPEPDEYPAETHVRIRPMSRTGLDNPGGGRTSDPKTRTIAVDLVTRDFRDQAGTDEVALTDDGAGHLRFEDDVLDALDLHTPVGPDGAALVVEPMREVATEDANRPKPGSGFSASTIHFQVKYVPRYYLPRT